MRAIVVAAAILLLEAAASTVGAQNASIPSDVIITWDSVRQITSDAFPDANPELFPSGDTIHLFWLGGEGIDYGAEYARSMDGGSNFEAPRVVSACGVSGSWITPWGYNFGVSGGIPFVTATNTLAEDSVTYRYFLGAARSADGGSTWDSLSSVLDCPANCFTWSDGFAGRGDTLYQVITGFYAADSTTFRISSSTDGGTSWEAPFPVPAGGFPARISASAAGLHFAGTIPTDTSDELGYYRTATLGAAWTGTVLTSPGEGFANDPDLASLDNGYVYALWEGSPSDLAPDDPPARLYFRRSSDNGTTWEGVQILAVSSGVEFPVVAASGSQVAAAWFNYASDSSASEAVIRVSTDFGASWSDLITLGANGNFTIALAGQHVHCAWVDNALMADGEIRYRRGVIGQVSAAGDPPVRPLFALLGNYPNPFNGSTAIGYSLDRRERISLRVYNILGVEVGTIADGIEEPGDRTAIWTPGDLPGGMYFYRLRAGQRTESGKMLYVK